MLSIVATGTALPQYRAELSEVREAARTWLKDSPDQISLFERFLTSTKTSSRHFIMPPRKIIEQQSLAARAAHFEEFAPGLGAQALMNALKGANLHPKDLDALIFTSCSCPVIPSPEVTIASLLGLRPDLIRIPIFQYGCAGGVAGISLAEKLAGSAPNIAVLSTELSSLVFQPTDSSPGALVGAALFGDGSAAAVLSSSPGKLLLLDSYSWIIPQSRHLMGYDIFDTGFHLKLDKDLPNALSEAFPAVVATVLNRNRLKTKDISWWLFHPGSSKIVERLENLLSLSKDQTHWAYEVLSEYGNLSSATILFVLDRFLAGKEFKSGERGVIAGIGPGLSIVLSLFEVA